MQSMMEASQHQLIRRATSLNVSTVTNREVDPNQATKRSSMGDAGSSTPQPQQQSNNNEPTKSSPDEASPEIRDQSQVPTLTRKKRRVAHNSWLNLLNPSYKTRVEEFRKLFAESVPSNERLVVDYSCALQKEILVHGRVYVSLNYICFYANIFKWETCVVIKCRDIASLTKAKTARVIPNAIQLVTVTGEKFILTSFAARDKTYVMMFRVWQNALLDQPMDSTELLKWVHYSYGDDLGYTSEEEEEFHHSLKYRDISAIDDSDDSSAEDLSPPAVTCFHEHPKKGSLGDVFIPAVGRSKITRGRLLAIDSIIEDGDDSDDEQEESLPMVPTACICGDHQGKQLVDEIFPISAHTMFKLVMNDSKFYRNVLDERKSTEVKITPWTDLSDVDKVTHPDCIKTRKVNYTVLLNLPMVKSAPTEETCFLQQAQSDLYMMEVVAVNSGVPYCDCYSVKTQWCITRARHESECRLQVHTQVIYHSNGWSFRLVKSMLEKNAIQGIADYVHDIVMALHKYCHDSPIADIAETLGSRQATITRQTTDSLNSRKSLRLPRDEFELRAMIEADTAAVLALRTSSCLPHSRTGSLTRDQAPKVEPQSNGMLLKFVFATLFILFFLNIYLFIQLWKMESSLSTFDSVFDSTARSDIGRANPEVIKKWKKVLVKAVDLVRIMETNLARFNDQLNEEF